MSGIGDEDAEANKSLSSILGTSEPQTCKTYLLVRPRGFAFNPVKVGRALEGKKEFRLVEIPQGYTVPKEFKTDGKVYAGMEVREVIDKEGVVLGRTRFDAQKRLFWREDRLLVLESVFALFVIRNVGSKLFLHVFASRTRADDFALLADAALSEVGLSVCHVELHREAMGLLQKELKGKHLDSKLMEIDSGASSSYWRGHDLAKSPAYRSTEKIAKRIRGYMLNAADPWDPDEEIVVGIGDDCLTRFYTNVTYRHHLEFIGERLVPKSHAGAKLTPASSYPLGAFDTEG